MSIRDRITELRRVRAGDLHACPSNWRTHPESQIAALRGTLNEIGYADAVLCRVLPTAPWKLSTATPARNWIRTGHSMPRH